MNGTIAAISPYGFKVEGHDNWINKSKGFEFDMTTLHRGSIVDYTLNSKGYCSAVKVVDLGTATAGSSNGGSALKPAYVPFAQSADTRREIARSTAVKAVLGGPILTKVLEGTDMSDAVSQGKELIIEMTNYILTGNFLPAEVNETAHA